ncbi:MAG: fimbrillin family protein [Bacteroidales bacterium]|nr:fimbrillin family protein [Bacteroidales bacterium]
MKKLSIIVGLVAMTALAVSCEKEAIRKVAESGDAFTIVVNADGSKTTVDNLATTWVEGDQINVFHAENGTGNYVSDGAFTVANITTGAFGGQLGSDLTAGKSYDWAVIYPYAEGNTASAAAFSIPATQTQDGNGSQAHLGGAPLWGNATAVAAETCPAATLSHIASYIRVKVKNTCGKTLTVHSVKFTATENIAGNFSANISGDTPAIAAAGSNSKTVLLNVENPTAIDNGATADFYLAINPFTAASGATLKLSVNDYLKPLILEADASFTAGKVKTLEYEYDLKNENSIYGFVNAWNDSGTKLALDATKFPDCVPYVDCDWVKIVNDGGVQKVAPVSTNTGLGRIAYVSAYDPSAKKVKGVYFMYQYPGNAWLCCWGAVGTNKYLQNKGNSSGLTNNFLAAVHNNSYDYAKDVQIMKDPISGLTNNVIAYTNGYWPSGYGGLYWKNANGTIVTAMQSGYTIEVYAAPPTDKDWTGGDSSQSILFSYNANTAKAPTNLITLGFYGKAPYLRAEINGIGLSASECVPEKGKYFHAVLVYDATAGKEYLYWNGKKVAERTETREGSEIIYTGSNTQGVCKSSKDGAAASNQTVCNPWIVGGKLNGEGNSSAVNWNGYIAYCNVYSTALTADEIFASFKSMHYAQNNE